MTNFINISVHNVTDHLDYQKKFKFDYSDINKLSFQNVTIYELGLNFLDLIRNKINKEICQVYKEQCI